MPAKPAILLDANAGAPLHPVVVEALRAFLLPGKGNGEFAAATLGNPSSTHAFGRAAESLVESARAAVLRSFQASPAEWQVTFTSGGSEANQLAVAGVLEGALLAHRAGQGPRPRWLLSEAEHSCVRALVEPMREGGVEVRTLPLRPAGAEGEGTADFGGAELPGATLLSVIGVGNETGLVQHPLTSHILSATPSTGLPRPRYHCDFVAGWGKVELDLSAPGAPDLVTIAAHKLGGLAGCGALIHRKSIPLRPRIPGNQQQGLRGGTENLFGIASIRALAENWTELRREIEALRKLRDRFETELRARIPYAIVTGAGAERAPHLSHVRFPGFGKDLSLVPQLDLRGFAVSSGSACASRVVQPSRVLTALGLDRHDALNALRISLHPGNRGEDLAEFLDALTAALARHARPVDGVPGVARS